MELLLPVFWSMVIKKVINILEMTEKHLFYFNLIHFLGKREELKIEGWRYEGFFGCILIVEWDGIK